jgi:FkbM family methyltransferase
MNLSQFRRSLDLVVVDVGARRGFQNKWEGLGPDSKLIGFEPHEPEFRRLVSAARENEKYINAALYSEPKAVTLFHTRDPSTSSIYPPNRETIDRFLPGDHSFDLVGTSSLQASTLDIEMSSMAMTRIDFLKIDTQGSELDILKGGEQIVSHGTFALEVEVEFQPLYLGQPLFEDVHSYLTDKSFQLMTIANVSNWAQARRWRQIGETDGVFGRFRGEKPWLYGDALYFPRIERAVEWAHHSRGLLERAVYVSCVHRQFEYAATLVTEVGRRGDLAAGVASDLLDLIERTSTRLSNRVSDSARMAFAALRKVAGMLAR